MSCTVPLAIVAPLYITGTALTVTAPPRHTRPLAPGAEFGTVVVATRMSALFSVSDVPDEATMLPLAVRTRPFSVQAPFLNATEPFAAVNAAVLKLSGNRSLIRATEVLRGHDRIRAAAVHDQIDARNRLRARVDVERHVQLARDVRQVRRDRGASTTDHADRLVDLSNRDRGRDGRGNLHHRSARNRRISRRLRDDRRSAAGDRRDRTIGVNRGNRRTRRAPRDTAIRYAGAGVHGRGKRNLITNLQTH